MPHLTLEQAQRAISAAVAKADQIGSPSSVAVLDAGRELLAFARMDDALLASAAIAQAKAYTARSMNAATKDLNSLVQPGAPLFGLQSSHDAVARTLVTFGGGVPVVIDGSIVGAVGVAGGTPDQDHEVAMAGAEAAATS